MTWAEELLSAAALRDERLARDLVAARWSDNEVTKGPLDDLGSPPRPEPPIPSILDGARRGYRLTQMIHVVAKLGVPDALTAGPRTAHEIALEVGADAEALERLLRALVDIGLLTQTADDRFGLGPAGQLLRSDADGSLRPAAIMYGEPWWWGAWGVLFEAVRTGRTAFDDVHGVGLFEFFASDSNAARLFHSSMQLMTSTEAEAVAAGWDFSQTKRLIDIGGGEGALMGAILGLHRHVSAVIFDRPLAVGGARKRLTSLSSEGRCDFVAGDFFVEVPSGGDTYVLKDIIHDWDDDRATAILRNARQAMASSARLLVVERVLPLGAVPSAAKLVDLSMLVLTGGRERTEAAYTALLARAGFAVTAVAPVNDEISVLEAAPA
jgi:O-methyltransferase domain/Dimerisation domain